MNNLPVQLTTFIGREHELEEVRHKLLTARLLTLSGPGGSGKTRLAFQLASELIPDFPDGIWFVDLVPLGDASLVAQKVLSAVGIQEQANRAAPDALASFFAAKRALLLLDNCEHLIEAVAALVDGLLRTTVDLSILTTGREALRLAGEVIWPVTPLAVPSDHQRLSVEALRGWDAIRLFADRAALNLPAFELTSENARSVAAICQQLDGLPLAIELAAPRMASMSPAQFLARLGDRLNLLSRSARGTPPKQRTLEATFDWSYGLLEDRERTLFRRLSVFSSLFTLEAVEAVCGEGIPADDVLELLTELVQKSLVVVEHRPGDEIRYRLLETVRRYARSKLTELGEHAHLEQRLAHFCLSIAQHASEQLHSPDAAVWMDLIDEQEDDLRAVLSWCLTRDAATGLELASMLVEYWDLRGHLTEGRKWLSEFLNLNRTVDQVSGNALAGAGLLAWRQGDNPSARSYYEDCLNIGRSTKNRELEACALRGLGDAALGLGDYGQAEAFSRESLAIFRAGRNTAETAQTLSRLGNAALNQSGPAASIPFYKESLALYRRLGDRIGIANQLWSLSPGEMLLGEFAQARLHLEECLSIRTEIKDELGIPYVHVMLGYADMELGDLRGAHTEFGTALPRLFELGDRWGISMALDFMSGLAVRAGRCAEGICLASSSEAVRASIGAQQLASIKGVADPWLAQARRHLTIDDANTAHRDGLQMTTDDAVDFALRFLEADPVSVAATDRGAHGLSRRELQVASLVSEGHTNREIAKVLFISERTVDNHVKHIFEKLNFRSRAQVGTWLARVAAPSTPSAAAPGLTN